ncbi:MAG: 2-isopropylmalate synthase [Candidatus Asgardarchaeum californiense]|nr:MAG: 2-isopropylmalate synthase [Candidatus Asgardarchaeum californiense]
MLKLKDNTLATDIDSAQYNFRSISEEPNFFEEIFPYDELPKIIFDFNRVPMNLPENIFITDTTFRDGEQAREPYTLEQRIKLFDFLHELGGPKGVIKMTEFFLYTKRDKETVKACLSKGYEYPRVTGWIRATMNDLELVKELKLEETGILASISDYHIYYKLKSNRRDILKKYIKVIEEALKNDIIPRVHLEDVTRADIYNVVLPFVKDLMMLSEKYGLPVKVRLPDTLGLGLPFPEVALPRSIPKIVFVLTQLGNVPSEWIEFHGHSDFHLSIANSMSAWLYGAGGVNCTLLGIGERTGNTPLEAMVMAYIQLKGTDDGMRTEVITEIAEYYEKEIGYQIPPFQPFVGKNFNVTRAGIHADGLIKNERVYLPFNTAKILKKPASVAITNRSGTAGIAFWINTHFKLRDSEKISKNDPSVLNIFEEIMREYDLGRITALSDNEMFKLIQRFMPEFWEKYSYRLSLFDRR